MPTKNATVFRVIRTGQNFSGRIDPQYGTMEPKVVEAYARFDDGTETYLTGATDANLQERKRGDRLILQPCEFNEKRFIVVGQLIF